MASETLRPLSIITQTGCSGTVSQLNNDPDGGSNGQWVTADSDTTDIVLEVNFSDASGTLTTGAGLQEIRARVAESLIGNSPDNVTMSVYEGGTLRATLYNVDNPSYGTGGAVISGTWDASLLSTQAPSADVRVRITCTADTAPAPQVSSLDVDSIEWNVAYGSTASGAGSSAGSATSAASGAGSSSSSGTSTATGSAAASGESIAASGGTSAGSSAASGASSQIPAASGTSTGSATASGASAQIFSASGASAGSAAASGSGSSESGGGFPPVGGQVVAYRVPQHPWTRQPPEGWPLATWMREFCVANKVGSALGDFARRTLIENIGVSYQEQGTYTTHWTTHGLAYQGTQNTANQRLNSTEINTKPLTFFFVVRLKNFTTNTTFLQWNHNVNPQTYLNVDGTVGTNRIAFYWRGVKVCESADTVPGKVLYISGCAKNGEQVLYVNGQRSTGTQASDGGWIDKMIVQHQYVYTGEGQRALLGGFWRTYSEEVARRLGTDPWQIFQPLQARYLAAPAAAAPAALSGVYIPKRPWTRQPQVIPPLDYSNPLVRGNYFELKSVFIPDGGIHGSVPGLEGKYASFGTSTNAKVSVCGGGKAFRPWGSGFTSHPIILNNVEGSATSSSNSGFTVGLLMWGRPSQFSYGTGYPNLVRGGSSGLRLNADYTVQWNGSGSVATPEAIQDNQLNIITAYIRYNITNSTCNVLVNNGTFTTHNNLANYLTPSSLGGMNGQGSLTADFPLVCVWVGRLSEEEQRRFHENPWQIFQPIPARYFAYPEAAAAALSGFYIPRREWTRQPVGNTMPRIDTRFGMPYTVMLPPHATAFDWKHPHLAHTQVSGLYRNFDFGVAGRQIRATSSSATEWSFPKRNETKSITVLFVGALPSNATGGSGVVARDATATGGWIPIWRNGGQFDMRIGSVDFTAAGTWTGSQIYSICTTAEPGRQQMFVDGKLVLSGTNSLSGAPDVVSPWYFFNNGGAVGGGIALNAVCYLFAVWDSAISAEQARELSENPWQLFQPLPARMFTFGTAGGTVASGTGSSAGSSTSAASGAATASSAGSSAGTSAATAAGSAIVNSAGAIDGTSAATAVALAIWAVAGSAIAASTAAAISASFGTAAGASAGTSAATGAASATTASSGSSAATSTASATSASTSSSTGTSAGTSTATGAAQAPGASTGSSAGTSTASAVGASVASSTASSAGTSTAAALSEVIASATGTSAGAATATAVGQAIGGATADGVGTAEGVASATGVGSATHSASAAAAGTASASGVALSIWAATGTSTAAATASAVAESTISATGTSTAAATASAVTESIISAAGSAAGLATAEAVSAIAAQPATGSAAGTSSATGVANAVTDLVGSAAASATASATGEEITPAAGTAAGTATASGVGQEIGTGTGASAGSSTAAATSSTVIGATGAAAGTSTAAATSSATSSGAGVAAGSATATGVSPTVYTHTGTGSVIFGGTVLTSGPRQVSIIAIDSGKTDVDIGAIASTPSEINVGHINKFTKYGPTDGGFVFGGTATVLRGVAVTMTGSVYFVNYHIIAERGPYGVGAAAGAATAIGRGATA